MFVTIGASGAIYGILLAFGMLFPNAPLYLFFIPVPIKAKWMVIGMGVIEILIGLSEAAGRKRRSGPLRSSRRHDLRLLHNTLLEKERHFSWRFLTHCDS